MKKFITLLLGAVGFRSLLVTYHKSRLLAAIAVMKRFGTETSMPVWCSRRFRRHLEALRWLGFVEQREFTLPQRAISGPECYRAFCQLVRGRFTDGYWSFSTSGTRSMLPHPHHRCPSGSVFFLSMTKWPNKSLQATRDGIFSSAPRFTLIGPACLSSDVDHERCNTPLQIQL